MDDETNILSALRCALVPILPQGSTVEVYTNPVAALERARQFEFDIVIADYRMPGLNGVELLRALRECCPDTIRLMLSGVSDFAVILDAVNSAQIFHFICKPWGPEQLREVIGKALAQRGASLRSRGDERGAMDAQARLALLTGREREVMQLMVAGKPSKVIARELGISARTVENHRARVMENSGAASLSELVQLKQGTVRVSYHERPDAGGKLLGEATRAALTCRARAIAAAGVAALPHRRWWPLCRARSPRRGRPRLRPQATRWSSRSRWTGMS